MRRRYHLRENYFLVSNQFSKHKNHQLVLDAPFTFKKVGEDALVVFTGREEDVRDPAYAQSLKDFVNENDLNEYVRFLGFIPRAEQIVLMKFVMR